MKMKYSHNFAGELAALIELWFQDKLPKIRKKIPSNK